MFETQTSWNKTGLGEICLNMGIHACLKVGQDQVCEIHVTEKLLS